MKPPFGLAGTLALACLIAVPALASGQEAWPRCRGNDNCPDTYLNLTIRQGDTKIFVASSCVGRMRRVWGEQEDRERAFGSLPGGTGTFCIELPPNAPEVRVTANGGQCGYRADDRSRFSAKPGEDSRLRLGVGGVSSAVLPGCHAAIAGGEIGQFAFGGIAISFADGYRFGSVYGLFDGMGQGGTAPLNVAVAILSLFNTYHYHIDVAPDGAGASAVDNAERSAK